MGFSNQWHSTKASYSVSS